MGLGSIDTFSLAKPASVPQLRESSQADGINPLEARRQADLQRRQSAANVLTFDQAAERYIASQTSGWKNEKHAAQWTSTLATYASPVVGGLSVNTIDTALVMRVLEPIWAKKTETASRVRGRMEKVLDWCKVRATEKATTRLPGAAT